MKPSRYIASQLRENRSLYIMLSISVAFMLLFVYYPFVQGIRIAFFDFSFISESKFIGLTHFKKLLSDEKFINAFGNTIIFGVFNCFLGVVLPAAMAVLLNEVSFKAPKRIFQTIIYLPTLFSWVIIGSIFVLLLSPTVGPVNALLEHLGIEPIYFFAEEKLAKPLFIILGQWKSVGFGLIVYLAAITGIDQTLYEAAEVDGATRFKKIIHITIPCIKTTMKMMLMFGIIGILSLFDQVFVLNNGMINREVNVVMTYIYGTGIAQLKLGYAAAAGLVVGAVTLTFTLISKRLLKFGFESEEG